MKEVYRGTELLKIVQLLNCVSRFEQVTPALSLLHAKLGCGAAQENGQKLKCRVHFTIGNFLHSQIWIFRIHQ